MGYDRGLTRVIGQKAFDTSHSNWRRLPAGSALEFEVESSVYDEGGIKGFFMFSRSNKTRRAKISEVKISS